MNDESDLFCNVVALVAGVAMNNNEWTKDEDKQLLILEGEKKTHREIGIALGRSTAAVSCRLHKMRLRPKPVKALQFAPLQAAWSGAV